MEDLSEMNERQTREELIDKQIGHVGWTKIYAKDEVNTIRSDFKGKTYVYSEGRGDKSGNFVDYLLLAEDNSPLSFIEAKMFSRD